MDIGGSGIKGAIVDTETGALKTDRYRLDTPQPATPQAVAQTFRRLVNHFTWSGPVGVGFPAVIQHGVARSAANIDKKWMGIDAQNILHEAGGCPVTIVNDADAAGLAEVKFGAGDGRDGLIILLTVGTGIGSAIINDGVLLPNTELGHLRFKGGIAEHYAADSVRKNEDLSWEKWGRRFNEYLSHVEFLFSPDVFVIGGGVSKKFHKYQDELEVTTPVIPAKLLNQAGIIGAALAAQAQLARQEK